MESLVRSVDCSSELSGVNERLHRGASRSAAAADRNKRSDHIRHAQQHWLHITSNTREQRTLRRPSTPRHSQAPFTSQPASRTQHREAQIDGATLAHAARFVPAAEHLREAHSSALTIFCSGILRQRRSPPLPRLWIRWQHLLHQPQWLLPQFQLPRSPSHPQPCKPAPRTLQPHPRAATDIAATVMALTVLQLDHLRHRHGACPVALSSASCAASCCWTTAHLRSKAAVRPTLPLNSSTTSSCCHGIWRSS